MDCSLSISSIECLCSFSAFEIDIFFVSIMALVLDLISPFIIDTLSWRSVSDCLICVCIFWIVSFTLIFTLSTFSFVALILLLESSFSLSISSLFLSISVCIILTVFFTYQSWLSTVSDIHLMAIFCSWRIFVLSVFNLSFIQYFLSK